MASLSASTVPFGATLGRPVDGDAMFRLSTCLAVSRCVYPLWPCWGWHTGHAYDEQPAPAEPVPPSGLAKDRLWGLLSADLGPFHDLPPELDGVLDDQVGKVPSAEGQVKHGCKYRIWWTLFNKAVSALAAGAPPRGSNGYATCPAGAVYASPNSGPVVLDSTGGVAAVPMDPTGLLTEGWIDAGTYGTALNLVTCQCNQYDPQNGGPPVLPTMADEDFDDFFGTTNVAFRGLERGYWRGACAGIGLNSWVPDEDGYRAGLTSTATYKEALGDGGTYAPPWRGATGPDYWKYSHSPYYLKQLDRYWEGVGDEWTEEFPYHGLAALSSVLEHAESRAVGFGVQLAAWCPRQSESDEHPGDVCRSSRTVDGVSSDVSVALHYSAVPSFARAGQATYAPVYPYNAPSGSMDVSMEPSQFSDPVEHLVHAEDGIRLEVSRSEALSSDQGEPAIFSSAPEFVIPYTAVADPLRGFIVSVGEGDWARVPASPEKTLGMDVFARYVQNLANMQPGDAWLGACEDAWSSAYPSVTVDFDISVGVHYSASLSRLRLDSGSGALRSGTFVVPAVSKRLVDAGVVSLSHVFFGKTWAAELGPETDSDGAYTDWHYDWGRRPGLPHACIWEATDPGPVVAFRSACHHVDADLYDRVDALGQSKGVDLLAVPGVADATRVASAGLSVPQAYAVVSVMEQYDFNYALQVGSGSGATYYDMAVPVPPTGIFEGQGEIRGSYIFGAGPVGQASVAEVRLAAASSWHGEGDEPNPHVMTPEAWRKSLIPEHRQYSVKVAGSVSSKRTYAKFAKGKMS